MLVNQPVVVDFEFKSTGGCKPVPHTLCAKELDTGTLHIYEGERLKALAAPPFPPGYTLLAFAADAELGCYEILGWPKPTNTVDLRVEHMMIDRNVSTIEHLGVNLEQALSYYLIPHACAENKKGLQNLGGRGEPYTTEERTTLTQYCMEDVLAEEKLFRALEPKLDESCFYRGQYMEVAASMWNRGIPFDVQSYGLIKKHALSLKLNQIRKHDPDFEIYTPGGTLKVRQLTGYLDKLGLLDKWPRTRKTGQPSTDKDDLRDLAKAFPNDVTITKLTDLFALVNLMKNFDLWVGDDGRHRFKFFAAFGAKTSRNTPSGSVFAPSKWVRSLIKPAPGHAVAYLDWASMEVGVGAWLSQDPRLLEAYASGDAHMYLAKASGAVPMDATKDERENTYPLDRFEGFLLIRSLFKTCNFSAMYGCTVLALIKKGLTPEMAAFTLGYHHSIFTVFWKWVENQIEKANDLCEAVTFGGWRVKVDSESKNYNPRSVGNFFVQANSAEIQRLAAILAYKRGLGLCAVVHDAFLLEAPIEDMQRQVSLLKQCMDEASRTLLDGFVLGVDGQDPERWITYPDRYHDTGEKTWIEVMGTVKQLEELGAANAVPCEV